MLVVALAGELDVATAGALERELRRAESCGARTVALDLRRLGFIETTGVRTILEARARLGRLLVVRGASAVQRVFELCGALGALQFVDELPPEQGGPRAGPRARPRCDDRATLPTLRSPRRPGGPGT